MRRLARGLLVAWLSVAGVAGALKRRPPRERIVPPGEPDPRAELVVLALLGIATLAAVGFLVVYATDAIDNPTQLLGICLGVALACLAAALIIVAKRLVVTEEREEEYPPVGKPEEQERLVTIVEDSGSRFTRKRLLLAAGGTAGAALGCAVAAPALSLGPWLDLGPLRDSPWRAGLRLIGSDGIPMFADQVEQGTFYTAFPENADRDRIASPIVVVRLDEAALRLPAGRRDWAPGGILAFSKICTHAGCAIALYRTPKFPPVEPRPALVCPCHYSTFDPATGGDVIFGPAGRPLPQLPLEVDDKGVLRASGDFSSPAGPSFSGVRSGRAR